MKRIIPFTVIILASSFTFSQENSLSHETPAISVGAEYNLLLQEKIRLGEDADLKVLNSPIPFDKYESSALITTYKGLILIRMLA